MTTEPAKPNDLIDKIVNLYQQYLDCSPERLDLLALWTMHTHIIPDAPFSPSLNICSRQKHSGKTVCLQLLSLLCGGARMHTAAAPSVLIHQLTDGYEPFGGTLLLDDCDATFGKTRMNIKLQGLFTARFQQDARFTLRVKDSGEYIFDDKPVFFPAAFAGNGRLHPSLAERSILIALEQKVHGSHCQPFRFYTAQNQARSLRYDLSDWGNANHERFEKIAPYKEDQFPPELSWRNRDCAEPLLHVADFIGGDWSQRARHALVNAFALAAFEDFYNSKQILSDIRDAFFEKGNPEWLSTTDLLSFLHTTDNRPWDTWTKDKPMQPKALARLLEPFGIAPRNHRTGPKTVPKGYHREDLEPAWAKHLAALSCDPAQQPTSQVLPQIYADEHRSLDQSPKEPVAADLQVSVPHQPELAASPCPEVPAEGTCPEVPAEGTCPEVPAEGTCPEVPAEGSQKPVAAVPVAAKMQNLTPSKPATSNQPKKTVPSSVAANLQNLFPRSSSSQKPAVPGPVAANLQTFAPTHPEARTGSPKSTNPVQPQQRLDAVLKSQPKEPVLRYQPTEATSQKQGANFVRNRKPTVGERILAQASSRSHPGNVVHEGINDRR